MGDLAPPSGGTGELPFMGNAVTLVVDAAKEMSDSAKIELPYCAETFAK